MAGVGPDKVTGRMANANGDNNKLAIQKKISLS